MKTASFFSQRITLLTAALLGTLLLTGNAFAQEKSGQSMTMKGEVLDMSCYMKSGAKGPDHKGCASSCLKKGNPVGLLGSDGKVYLMVEDHDNAAPYKELANHAAEQVTITGTFQNRNGMPGIIVAKAETEK